MSALSACSEASLVLTGRPLATLFSATGHFEREMQYLVNEAARAIAKAADWQGLTKLCTFNGDGVAQSFPLPDDYDRMTLAGQVYSTRSTWPMRRVEDLNQWLDFTITGVVGDPGCWIILGGAMQFLPVLASGDSAKFYYVTNRIASGGKATFSADSDTFLLSERLLTLALVWRWRALKRLEYSEDLRNFEIAFSEEAGRDRGAKMLAVGRARIPAGIGVAYPGVITP
ncbi:phage adaptor protein [Xanthobacter autotrophicus]|uniref:phage adaptor protein n=1 Tax=Xanthobacter autotrophicus TaxID=280 RepID=UPI003729DAC8